MAAYIDGMPANGRIAELVELARRTTSRLAILWEEVGYSDEEKGRQMEGLIDGFRTLCENKVSRAKSKSRRVCSVCLIVPSGATTLFGAHPGKDNVSSCWA